MMNFFCVLQFYCVHLSFPAGVIEFLVSRHPIAQILRDHVVFKIVAILNPDGVYLGNYRSAETNSHTHNIILYFNITLYLLFLLQQ